MNIEENIEQEYVTESPETIDEEFLEILRYCREYACSIMAVAAHATFGADNSVDYDKGLMLGIVYSLAPMFREVFDMDEEELFMLEQELEDAVGSVCLSVRSQAATIGRA